MQEEFVQHEDTKVGLFDLSCEYGHLRFPTLNTIVVFGEVFWGAEYQKRVEQIKEIEGLQTANSF